MRKKILVLIMLCCPLVALPQQPGQELKPDAPLPVMVFHPGPEPLIEILNGQGGKVLLRWSEGGLNAEGDYQSGAQTLFHLFEAQIRASIKGPCERPLPDTRPKNCGPWRMRFRNGIEMSGNSCLPE